MSVAVIQLAWQRATAPTRRGRMAVVLVHGWAGQGSDWEKAGWIGGLVEAGLDVLVCDLPGHAASGHVRIPDDAEPAAWTAEVIRADLDQLHVKSAAVLAYADSCPVAGHLAVRAPSTFVRVGFIACDDQVGYAQGAEAAAALRDPSATVWRIGAADLVRRAHSDPRHDGATLSRWLLETAWPAAPRLGAMPTPVLLAVGTEDRHRARAPRLAALFSDARLVTVPGDEVTMLSAPALVEAVADFLAPAAPA
jgi:pimeloyl-ACP methyl ester carboxylesterase